MKIFKKHICKFNVNLYNIHRIDGNSSLISKCKCGEIKHTIVHLESDFYNDFIKKA